MYEPDDIDWKIILLLNQDGRMSSAEIARKLGNISARTVTNRIAALREHGIIDIRAIVNPDKVGYSVMADVLVEIEPGRVKEVAQQAARFPQCSYVACATGDSDVSISLRVRSIDELFSFVTEKLSKIPGVRRTHSYILPLKLKDMDTWMPPEVFERNGSETSIES
ncbi:MAG: Lrp/AsnC family transcriptional regulator [Chloroflexi bacterium]|nr:MAG: Lrp/AsnC family transcriptional regulator [Chloroflexota bacterium]